MNHELDDFIAAVKDRSGHADLAPVAHAVRATLLTLGGHLGGLPPALHDAIPASLRAELATGRGFDPLRPAALYQRVAEEGELRVGIALELVQSTMTELSARLLEPARALLRESLPPAWAVLVTEPSGRPQPISGVPRTGGARRGTLASGRPGGTRPLADAAPYVGQADSIAASDDPHPARIAAARGPGPRKEEHTLAEGHPGSDHPLASVD